ncbi:MAG: metalloregulator ArsR/SmtB family transcription factor [Myxococcota bacterium]
MSDAFEALAHPLRRELLERLQQEGELAAGELAEQVDVSKPTLSHHLKVLTEAGLIDRERRGTFVYYRINQSLLEEVVHKVFALMGVGAKDRKPA